MRKLAIAIMLLFVSYQCLADVTCLKVSGNFNGPIAIWKSRWQQYNGNIVEISSNQVLSVYGYYLEDGKRNGLKYWKQISGNNAIWFGDRCNPINSYDVWYIGDPSCVLVPSSRMSIPRIPTFIPNILEYGRRNFDILDRPKRIGYPVIESITFKDLEFTNLLNGFSVVSIDLETDNPIFIEAIDTSNNDVKLWWKDNTTNSNYLVMRSFDLINWEEASIKIVGSSKVNSYSEMRDKPSNPAYLHSMIKENTNRNNSVFFKVIKSKK